VNETEVELGAKTLNAAYYGRISLPVFQINATPSSTGIDSFPFPLLRFFSLSSDAIFILRSLRSSLITSDL
jgi:hypothetical protein